jgi:hypothetical protein
MPTISVFYGKEDLLADWQLTVQGEVPFTIEPLR